MHWGCPSRGMFLFRADRLKVICKCERAVVSFQWLSNVTKAQVILVYQRDLIFRTEQAQRHRATEDPKYLVWR